MIKMWYVGATTAQKVAGVIWFVLFIWPLQIFISHSFAPNEVTLSMAHWASLGFTVFFAILFIFLFKTSTTKTRMPYSGIKKWFLILCFPFFIYAPAWIIFAYSAPQLITIIIGDEKSYLGKAVKIRSPTFKLFCRYTIKPSHNESRFLSQCISHKEYFYLNEREFEALFNVKETSLGIHYNEIKPIPIIR